MVVGAQSREESVRHLQRPRRQAATAPTSSTGRTIRARRGNRNASATKMARKASDRTAARPTSPCPRRAADSEIEVGVAGADHVAPRGQSQGHPVIPAQPGHGFGMLDPRRNAKRIRREARAYSLRQRRSPYGLGHRPRGSVGGVGQTGLKAQGHGRAKYPRGKFENSAGASPPVLGEQGLFEGRVFRVRFGWASRSRISSRVNRFSKT